VPTRFRVKAVALYKTAQAIVFMIVAGKTTASIRARNGPGSPTRIYAVPKNTAPLIKVLTIEMIIIFFKFIIKFSFNIIFFIRQSDSLSVQTIIDPSFLGSSFVEGM
jgi:hypothetical protein